MSRVIRDRARARYGIKSIRGIPIEELSGYHSVDKQQELMARYGAERYQLARHELRMRSGTDGG